MNEIAPGLTIADVTVRFGGLVAVSGLSLRADPGTITGLIGPNGAGKTTTFNACTGNVPVSSGEVLLGDVRLNGKSPSARAALGLGRTFQRMELFDSLTVEQNVALGVESFLGSRNALGQLISTGRDRRQIKARTERALTRCGIEMMSGRHAGDLSTGQRRLVELARAIATPFRFLLLDEPSSGLDPDETDRFGEILTDFVSETGVGVLLVEHDMALVSGVCSYIYVLDFGRLICEGPTRETLNSPIVVEAYLGAESTALEEAAHA